jgi:hypothetical protein
MITPTASCALSIGRFRRIVCTTITLQRHSLVGKGARNEFAFFAHNGARSSKAGRSCSFANCVRLPSVADRVQRGQG